MSMYINRVNHHHRHCRNPRLTEVAKTQLEQQQLTLCGTTVVLCKPYVQLIS